VALPVTSSDAGAEMKSVMSSLRARLSVEGAAWSGGFIGHQFANGPNGCLAQLDWAPGSADAKTGAEQPADCFERTDRSSAKSASPCRWGSCLRSRRSLTTAEVILGAARGEERYVGEQPTLSGGEAAAQRPVLFRGAGKRLKIRSRRLATEDELVGAGDRAPGDDDGPPETWSSA
jgi:hypothetical protein